MSCERSRKSPLFELPSAGNAMTTRLRFILAGVILLVAAAVGVSRMALRAAGSLPAQLSDQEFWKLTEDISEPNGFFQSDNLLSNEIWLQYVIPDLVKRTK